MPKDATESNEADSFGEVVRYQEESIDSHRTCESRFRRAKPVRHVGTGPRSDRTLTLATAASEYIWLYDLRHGLSIPEIAIRAGVSVGRVRYGVKRALAQEKPICSQALNKRPSPSTRTIHPPRLVPLFPIGPYTPQSACPHRVPIEPGSLLCCMVCHRSGVDDHPAMQRDPRTDPIPEPKLIPTSVKRSKLSTRHVTRKERRRRRFDQQASATWGSL
jgi:hypothetical protein